MDHVTGSMVFEEVTPDVPAMLRHFRRALRMEIRTVGTGEALLALNDIGSAGKATHRQLPPHPSVIRCFPRMQRFAHCPKHGFQPSRLRSSDTERGDKFILVQTQQMGASRRRAEAAYRSRGMKAQYIVVTWCQNPTHSALKLVARDKRGQDIHSR